MIKQNYKKNIILGLFIVISFFAWPRNSQAAQLNLPKDANGWTIFTPSNDSRIVYIAADGNDSTGQVYDDSDAVLGGSPLNPTGAINAYATFAAAYSQTRQGYPDWILFKRGDTFNDYLGTTNRSGRSASEPFLIGTYGAEGNAPIIQTAASNTAIRTTEGLSYLVFSGLDFYAKTRNPNDGGALISGNAGISIYVGEYSGPNFNVDNLLVEGCKFRFYENNTIQNGWTGNVDITIRRCSFLDDYSNTGHSQGLYASLVNNLLFEENVMVHNGWYQQQIVSGASDAIDGQATQFNHNIYWASVKNPIIRNNLLIDGSSAGIKLTGEHTTESTNIENNLFLGNEISISMGNNYMDNDYRFPNTTINSNIITNTGRLRPTNRTIGWGMWLAGLDNSMVSENLLISADPEVSTFTALSINSDISRNVAWENNTIFNPRRSYGLAISAGSAGSNGITFSGNKVQFPGSSDSYIIRSSYNTGSEWSFFDNSYYSGNQLFYTNGAEANLSAWNNWSSDNSIWSEINFPDDTRDIDTYMGSIGETATIDAFIVKARAQDRYNWDDKYMAESVNSWIKAGFNTTTATRGDVDDSAAITTTDALLTLRNSLGLSMTETAWQVGNTTGDVNCDDVSNSTDALLILRYSLGLNMTSTAWCEGS